MNTSFDKFFIGFDNYLQNPLFPQQAPEYPRYNVEKFEDGYALQMAVPGWKKEQIVISMHKQILSIKGEKKEVTEDRTWIHKGISGKSFAKHFKLDDGLEVESAVMEDGMLTIKITYSAATRPTSIPIG